MSLFLASCSKEPARVLDAVKVIPLFGGRDTMFIERSDYWDVGHSVARVDSNRQAITFKPAPGDIAFLTLSNMGGVPLRRDTIRTIRRESAETYFRTGTRDTNMRLMIESPDARRPTTNIVIYIRNRDSIYREFLFSGR